MRHLESLPLLNLAASLLSGDGTFRWNGEPFNPTEGYQVGGIDTLTDPDSVETLARWLSERYDEFPFTTYVGSWTDPETGTLYIDVSDHWPASAREEALRVAEIFEEKAIWDWANSEAISVE